MKPVQSTATCGLRIAKVRKANGRELERGLVWVEAYLPFDPHAFGEFSRKCVELGSAVAVAAAEPELARKALTPIDAHGEAMLAADVELLAHRYLTLSRKMDVQHDETARKSVRIVESFVNGPEVESPHFYPGAWVVVFQVDPGSPEWEAVQKGELNAVSFQAVVIKQPVAAAL